MSNYKQLKSNPEYNVSLVDIMSFVTRTNKAKYLELFCKLYKNKNVKGKKNNDHGNILSSNFDLPQEEVDTLTSLGTYIHYILTQHMVEDIKMFQKFVNLNERGLIDKNDVTSYTSIDELKLEISKSESKFIEKEMEKQVHKVLDDEEWLMLRPLTFESSKKYGSDTKWCTTYHDRTYFDKYTRNGILMYMINKKTGLKVAVFKSTKHKENDSEVGRLGEVAKEFSFWDQKDVRVDSMETGLPDYVKSSIMDEINNNPLSNLEVYAKRNKINVPNENEFFKKKRSIGRTLMESAQDTDDEPTAQEELPVMTYDELRPRGPVPGRPALRRLLSETVEHDTNEARRRVRALMGFPQDTEVNAPTDPNIELRSEVTNQNISDILERMRLRDGINGAISAVVSTLQRNRTELENTFESERIDEANEEVQSEFMTHMRELEEQHQQEQYTEEYLREMNLRESRETQGVLYSEGENDEIGVEDSEEETDIANDEEEVSEDYDENFESEMEERFGEQHNMVATINFENYDGLAEDSVEETTNEQPPVQISVFRRR